MCNNVLKFYLESKKFDWLKRESSNPYAVVYTKVDYLLSALIIIPVLLVLFFIEHIPGIGYLMVLSGIVMWLGTISWIKNTPADINHGITKPMLCLQLVMSKLFVLSFIYQGIVRLTT